MTDIDFTDLETMSENENTEENVYPILVTDVPLGETPHGTMSAGEFAAYLTKKRLEKHMKGEPGFDDFYVTQQSVYQRVKAKREPLPHVLVQNEVPTVDNDGNSTGSEVRERVFILAKEAERDWDKPRVRGRAASVQDDSVEGRLLRIGKALVKLSSLEKRNARVTEQLEKQRNLAARYDQMLATMDKTRNDALSAVEDAEESAEAEQAEENEE